ncbi:MAG: alpha-galactosidase [Candidatus Lernaella stagnicola]|nr:alpha-galactosidase [Candidatus Lernaella stagnicola]
MELRTPKMELIASENDGVRKISAPRLSFVHLVSLTAACRFRFGADEYYLTRPTPDEIVQEEDRILASYHWSHRRRRGQLTLEVEYQFQDPSLADSPLLIYARLFSNMPAPVFVLSIEPLLVRSDWGGAVQIGHSPAEWSILRNGWQSWSATRTYRASERDRRPRFNFLSEMEENVANPSPGKRGEFTSEQVMALVNTSSGQSIVAGFLTCRDAFGDVRVSIDSKKGEVRRFAARASFDGVRVDNGETLEADPLWLRIGTREENLLDAWARQSGRAMNARVPKRSPIGWCSWYHYYTKVTQDALLANLDQLVQLRDQIPMDVFQLDDGYERAIGDWLETNDKFPDGLAPLAARIAEAGFTPGIWTAPFLVDPKSRLATEHPDWLLRNDKGKPIRGVYNPLWNLWRGLWALDASHPEVQAWLTETFAALRRMGWSFFKIDFLYSTALPGVRHDDTRSRAAALRLGLEAIRRGIGEDATLLGCGCPLGPAAGIVDIMRIGPDVTPRWSNPMRPLLRDHHCLSTVHAVRNTIHRHFLHRRWWLNDPDCLLARDKKNKLTLPEIRTFASLATISGGMFLLSDDMTEYAVNRLGLVKTALAQRCETMRVLDAESGEFPTRMLAATEDGYLLLVINYGNQDTNLVVDLKDFLDLVELARVEELMEVWHGHPVLHQDGLVSLGRVAAHGCRLLRIRLTPSGESHG